MFIINICSFFYIICYHCLMMNKVVYITKQCQSWLIYNNRTSSLSSHHIYYTFSRICLSVCIFSDDVQYRHTHNKLSIGRGFRKWEHMTAAFLSHFRKPWPRKFIVGMQVHHLGIQVVFVYEGHRVKFTAAKERFCLLCSWVVCVRLKGNFVVFESKLTDVTCE